MFPFFVKSLLSLDELVLLFEEEPLRDFFIILLSVSGLSMMFPLLSATPALTDLLLLEPFGGRFPAFSTSRH